ncbi:response regulator [Horticoccus sp. 23ND18S-11]|uniref:response regulator n=1 Tax=Horticoccus sp. 23ND18S-11 TaxID=3391832 RepID=UPI0039C8F0D3
MIRVLYAEDDPQVADMVSLYFARFGEGCTIEVVGNGRLCLEALDRATYDVVMLDLMMPELDGLQVLGELTARRDPTPVIMVSGQGQHELAVRALRAGAADCIDKNSPDFRRIPEIVKRVHARNKRRLGQASASPGNHRVLFVDPDDGERHAVSTFIAAAAPRLRLTASSPETLERFLAGEVEFDAVVLGPNLEPTALFDALRHLRARDEDLPVIVIARFDHADTTIAAFKLGAQDYLLKGPGCFDELVFSLNHALKRADAERLNARLTDELAGLNESLAAQVAARTHELQQEVAVRRQAEKRSEDNAARLQALSTRLLQVQEEERRALAQELHDQIGQLLTGLRFQLEAAREAASSPPLDQALIVTSDLLSSVRELTLQLRPRMLDDLGLKPALEWQTKLFQNQTGIVVELELALPEKRLSPELETTVFRMVQEALTNVARHSGSPAAVVTVTADDTALHVEISDRGRGFDSAAALARRDSLGLAGLAERVRLAGGHLDIFSQAGQGTRLHAEFSLHLAAPPPT